MDHKDRPVGNNARKLALQNITRSNQLAKQGKLATSEVLGRATLIMKDGPAM